MVLEELGFESDRKQRETDGKGAAKDQAILRAMVEHHSNEAVHKECCVALAKLTAKHQKALKFFRLGTGEVILESMQSAVQRNQRPCAKVGLSGLGKLGREP